MSISSDAESTAGVLPLVDDVTDPPSYHGLNAIGYVRVSTDRQADEGLSLDVQTARIQGMAVAQGTPVAEVIVEAGASAKSLQRPGMARLLTLVEAGAVRTIIIAKLDRLTRSIGDLVALLTRFERRGVALVSVAESLDTRSSAGRLVLHIMGSVSQWEREAISERTKDALQHKKSHGELVGTAPYGSRVAADGVHLEPAPVEQRLVAHLRALQAEGLSTREIAAALNRDGWTTRKGTAWRFEYVARILRRTS